MSIQAKQIIRGNELSHSIRNMEKLLPDAAVLLAKQKKEFKELTKT